MSAVIDNRLLLRRVDVLEAKARRYEAELIAYPADAGDAHRIMRGILADLYGEQRSLIAYANEIDPPQRDYLEGFA